MLFLITKGAVLHLVRFLGLMRMLFEEKFPSPNQILTVVDVTDLPGPAPSCSAASCNPAFLPASTGGYFLCLPLDGQLL